MPTEQENVQYLYLVLTHGGAPKINWDAVGAAMNLKKEAVTKRWSRLKQSMKKGETPSGSVYTFLWLCLKHSSRDKPMNWQEIADACGTTSGAASKRYSRMKQAFEDGNAAPGSASGSPAPKTPGKSSPRKKKAAFADEDGEASPTPTATPKRKRATPKKKTVDEDAVNIKRESEPEEDEDVEMEEQSPKKSKVTKPKATPKPKVTAAKSQAKKNVDIPIPTTEDRGPVKKEAQGEEADQFVDAKEWVKDLVDDDEKSQADRVDDWLNESV